MSRSRYTDVPDRFSRQWWLGGLHTFFWVAVVTGLVWIYADLQFVDKAKLKARFVLTTGQSDIEILSGSERDFELDFEVSGNSWIVDRFKRDLADLTSRGARLKYDVSPLDPGKEHLIDTENILNTATGVAQSGLRIISISRPSVRVHLDRVLEQPVRVKFSSGGATLDGTATIDPPEVTIRVGAKAWEEILRAQNKPEIETVEVDLTDGVPTPRPVDLLKDIAGVDVRPKPAQVSVTYKVRELTDELSFNVSVRPLSPLSWYSDESWKRYTLEVKDESEWRPSITVLGPRTDLDQLRNRTTEVDAYIVLTENDKQPVSWLPGKVIIRFPSDLQIRLKGEPPTVGYRLVERGATPPAK